MLTFLHLIFDSMARLGRNGFLAIAAIFHLIYMYSIFDIYFVSPIVSGMRAFSSDISAAPAKRLVLFVGMTLLGPYIVAAQFRNETIKTIGLR